MVMVASWNGLLAVVRLLLSMGADPNSRNARDTALSLSLAADNDYLEICLLLVSHAADLLGIAWNGQTALDLYDIHRSLTPEVKKQRRALPSQGLRRRPAPESSLVCAGLLFVSLCVAISSRLQLARQGTCS